MVNRDEFVRKIAKKLGKSIKDTREFEDALEATLIELWDSGETLHLHGFGKFVVRELPARKGRNPKTGEPVNVGRTVIPRFKPSDIVKNELSKE